MDEKLNVITNEFRGLKWELKTFSVPLNIKNLINDYKGKMIYRKADFNGRTPRKRKKLMKKFNILYVVYGFEEFAIRKILKFHKRIRWA